MPIYNCHLCCKIYTNQPQYEEHLKVCTDKTNFDKGKMTLHQVSKMVLELCDKIKILEIEKENDRLRIDKLEACIKRQNRESSTNTTKILNLIQPDMRFAEWIKTIHIRDTYFDTIFNYSLKDGILEITKDAFLKNKCSIPIQAPNNTGNNTIYIFDKDENDICVWKKMTISDFTLFMQAIHKLIKHAYFIESVCPPLGEDITTEKDIDEKYGKDVKVLANLTQNEILEIKQRCFDRLRG